jgi:hypothetical protein
MISTDDTAAKNESTIITWLTIMSISKVPSPILDLEFGYLDLRI